MKKNEKRSAKYWKTQYQKTNNKLIICRQTRRAEGWQSIIKAVIQYGVYGLLGVLLISKLPEILREISGKETKFNADINLFGPDPWKYVAFALTIAVVVLLLANANLRKTNENYVKKYSPLQKRKEENAVEHRSSSDLNDNGTTRKEDK